MSVHNFHTFTYYELFQCVKSTSEQKISNLINIKLAPNPLQYGIQEH